MAGNVWEWMETPDGEVLVRTQARRVRAAEFADIPIKTLADGSRILLGDIAALEDGFAEGSQVFEFNGRPGLRLDVYQTENQRPIELAARIRDLVERAIQAAFEGNYGPFRELHAALARPFDNAAAHGPFAVPPAPAERVTRTFCGT